MSSPHPTVGPQGGTGIPPKRTTHYENTLQYFAAHAPDVPAWWPEVDVLNGSSQVDAELSRLVAWRYAYAAKMMDYLK